MDAGHGAPPRPKAILHVDMDAFYASVELAARPELRGQPLIVGAEPKDGKGRGVVMAASYEARKFGVRSAMPISRAWALCPQAIYVLPRFQLYEQVSGRIMETLRPFSDSFEQISIDEAVMDCTKQIPVWGGEQALAVAIQAKVREAAGVSCSAGVAAGKVIAKIACESQKPAGITIVAPGTEREFLAALPAARIPGIGPKTTAALTGAGIDTIGQLAEARPHVLRKLLGSSSRHFLTIARGEDRSVPDARWEAKSISEEFTFGEDEEDRGEVGRVLAGMADRLAAQLHERWLTARNVTVKLRFRGFETHTVSRTLASPTRDGKAIGIAASGLLQRFSEDDRPVRLAGLRLAELVRIKEEWTLSHWKGMREEPGGSDSESRPERGPASSGTRDRWRF